METFEYDTAETLRIFESEVSAAGGTTSDHFRDEHRLFARSVVPLEMEVKPADAMNSGVALRQVDNRLVVYPFLFRQVCKNGQIMAKGSNERTTEITIEDGYTAELQIREAVQACLAPGVFESVMEEVRKSPRDTTDFLMSVLPTLKKLLQARHPRRVRKIMRRFEREEERSRFGLMNAVTAIARDVEDPQVRWDLEELGGAIGVGAPVAPPSLDAKAKARRSRSKVKKSRVREARKAEKRESRATVKS